MASLVNSMWNIYEESVIHLSNSSKIWREAITPTLIEKPITLIPKSEKDTTRKENYRPFYLINIDAKTHNKILANEIEQYLKRIITMTKRDLSLGYKSINVIHHINRMKVFLKKHAIISQRQKKHLTKYNKLLWLKTFNKLGV